jgi:hypothetical protein
MHIVKSVNYNLFKMYILMFFSNKVCVNTNDRYCGGILAQAHVLESTILLHYQMYWYGSVAF